MTGILVLRVGFVSEGDVTGWSSCSRILCTANERACFVLTNGVGGVNPGSGYNVSIESSKGCKMREFEFKSHRTHPQARPKS